MLSWAQGAVLHMTRGLMTRAVPVRTKPVACCFICESADHWSQPLLSPSAVLDLMSVHNCRSAPCNMLPTSAHAMLICIATVPQLRDNISCCHGLQDEARPASNTLNLTSGNHIIHGKPFTRRNSTFQVPIPHISCGPINIC